MGVRRLTAGPGPVGRSAAGAVLLGVVLAGCTGHGGGPGVSPSPSAATESPAVTPLGVPVTLSLADGRPVSVTVSAVAVAPTCPGRARPTQPAELGYFVVLDVTVQLAPSSAPATADALPVSAEDFAVVGPDGVRQPISSTPASWACLEEADLLDPFVEAGTTARGKVVLDARDPEGVVVLELPGVGTAAWAF